MITEPRYLILNDIPYLVAATKVKGKITEIHGPYQCVGSAGMQPEVLIKELLATMTQALHSGEPLTVDDLPDNVLEDLRKAEIIK